MKRRRGSFNIGFVNGESEVFLRPHSSIFLQHHHACLATGPQEEPPAAFVPQPNFKAEGFAVEGFGLREIFHPDRYLVKTADWQHLALPFVCRRHQKRPLPQEPVTLSLWARAYRSDVPP